VVKAYIRNFGLLIGVNGISMTICISLPAAIWRFG